MSLPREQKPINPADYVNNAQFAPVLNSLLTSLRFDGEDQEVFKLYMFSSENPSPEAVEELAIKYGTTPEVVQAHAQGLYKKFWNDPNVKMILKRK